MPHFGKNALSIRYSMRKSFNQQFFSVLTHLFSWVFFFVLLNYRWLWGNNPPPFWFHRFLINSAGLIAYFYLNAFFLFELLFKRRGALAYILGSLLVVVIFSQGIDKINDWLFELRHRRPDRELFLLMPYFFIWGISSSYRIMADYSARERLLKEKENETLKTELAFLRSQVSPHFMFNVLNSMVSLARKKSDLLEPALIQLSGIMRYMLYESNSNKIPLEDEINYLRSYVDLQMLRFGDDLELIMHFPKDLSGYEIEPMLLISLVENAFKHGVGARNNSGITLTLEIDKPTRQMDFTVENALNSFEGEKEKSSGIGLQNMRRRLELLYNNKFSLNCSKNSRTFHVNLKIDLS